MSMLLEICAPASGSSISSTHDLCLKSILLFSLLQVLAYCIPFAVFDPPDGSVGADTANFIPLNELT